jgi:probable phosphoglycerate mutase
MLDLIFIRHGETEFNRLWRFQGHSDIPLNDFGLRQAERVGQRLALEPIAAIVASDLIRARQTAAPTAQRLGLPVHTDARWREQAFGLIEGLTATEIAAEHPEVWARVLGHRGDDAPPGGESRIAFSARVDAALADLVACQADGTTVAVFTHGGVLDMLWRRIHGQSMDTERRCEIPNCGVNRLRWDQGELTIVEWAADAHMDDLD